MVAVVVGVCQNGRQISRERWWSEHGVKGKKYYSPPIFTSISLLLSRTAVHHQFEHTHTDVITDMRMGEN
jgi:hypothetical protein